MKSFTNQKLGLDIGTKSLGWSIIGKTENDTWEIVDLGVRLWEAPEEPKSLDSAMMVRRGFRSQRRMYRRRQARIKDLKKILEQSGLITIKEIEEHFIHLKAANDFNVNNPKYEKEINPIYLRAKGLEEKLTPLQIAIVLINYAKRRGYNNVFETDDKRSGVSEAKKFVEKYQFPVYAILKDDFFRDRSDRLYYRNNVRKPEKNNSETKSDESNNAANQKEHILFLRADYKNELEQILKTQSQYYDSIDEAFLKQMVEDIVFRQRDFEDGPGPKENKEAWEEDMKQNHKFNFYPNFLEMVGKCQYFKEEDRTHNYSILGDIFTILNVVNQILVLEEIDKENQQNFIGLLSFELINNYLKKPVFNEKEVEKVVQTIEGYKPEFINIKSAKWSDVKFFVAPLLKIDKQFVAKYLPLIDVNDFNSIINNPINQLGTILYENKTPKRVIKKIQQIDTDFFQDEQMIRKHFLNFNKHLSSKVYGVSSKYIYELMQEALNKNNTLNRYNHRLNQENLIKLQQSNAFNRDFLKTIPDVDMIRNKVVFKALNQVRKVLRQILKTYGDMDEIIIEVAGDLYSEVDVRKKIRDGQDRKEKENLRIEEIINSLGERVNSKNKERVKLFLQQKEKRSDINALDPYSLYKEHPDEILLENIFSNDYEVDHILPYSLVHDDSLNNKVLVKRDYNQRKRARSVIDWLKAENIDKKQIEAYVKNVKKMFKTNNQKFKNLTAKDISRSTTFENQTSQINDTRYITTYITNYLKNEFAKLETKGEKIPTIITINGRMTSQFRRRWLWDSPWGQDAKVRNITPFHHAVDAIILTNISDKIFIFKLNTILRLQNYFYFLKHKLDNGYWDEAFIEKQIEFFQKTLHYNLTVIKRYLKNNDLDEIDFGPEQEEELRTHLDEVIEYVFSKFWNREKIDWKKDALINKYSTPKITNLIEQLETIIPVKLKINYDKEGYPIELESIHYPKEWSENTKRSEKEYPFISNKIERRMSGAFGDQNAVKKNKVLEAENPDKYYKGKDSDNYFVKKKYIGLLYQPENNSFVKYSLFDAVNDAKNNDVKNDLIISKNVVFKTEDNHIYLFKGFGGPDSYMAVTEINLHHSNKYNELMKMTSGYKLLRQIKIISNSKILHINSLGKLQGAKEIK